MMKPITYFVDNDIIEQLSERFGDQLELLDRSQKLQLRTVLTYLILGKESMGEEYKLSSAQVDLFLSSFVSDSGVDECFEILEEITVDQAESLLEALQAQCRRGNARLKTSLESQAESLIESGLEEDLAKQAA